MIRIWCRRPGWSRCSRWPGRPGSASWPTQHLSVPTDKGANAGLKVTSLVAGMVAGADSIDDMALLRHGGMGRVFDRAYAPSTLGSFLRAFTFGHVRQLDAVASRFLTGLADQAPLLAAPPEPASGCWSTSTTPSSRSTATPSRARGTATPGSAGSTRCSPPSPPTDVRAGDRGPAAAEGIVRFTARREAAGRRRA